MHAWNLVIYVFIIYLSHSFSFSFLWTSIQQGVRSCPAARYNAVSPGPKHGPDQGLVDRSPFDCPTRISINDQHRKSQEHDDAEANPIVVLRVRALQVVDLRRKV